MSKLLVAFVHGDDAQRVSEELRSRGHRFTHLPSLGGFLESENATIVLGVEDEDEADVVDVFETVCQRRELEVPLVLLDRLADWQAKTVAHGGATILVADLAKVIRI
jgi:uncharacterized protein YaaQ